MQAFKKKNLLKVLVSLLIPTIFILFKPLGLSIEQSIVMGALFLTILWWGTGWIHKDAASLFLLVTLLVFGKTSAKDVFYFVLSDNLVLIVASFLLSQGIINSRDAYNISLHFLSKYCYTSKRLVAMSFVLGFILIFIVPQPFPRVILLASIYNAFLEKHSFKEESKKTLILSAFIAVIVTSLASLNGDVIINYTALSFGNVNLSYFEWAKYMTLPTLLTTGVVFFAFILVFRRDLKDNFTWEKTAFPPLTREGKKALIIIALTLVFWISEPFHGVPTSTVGLVGAILMFIFKVINLKDLKAINVSLLIFLTVEFAIGRVLVANGTAEKISSLLTGVSPNPASVFYIPFIILMIILFHMLMGSLVTAVTVLIPTLLATTTGNLSSIFIVLLTCTVLAEPYSPEANGIACPETARYNDRSIRKERTPC